MDFGEVLQTAKQNGSSKQQIQYYSTKFAPPKKEQRNKTVSVNVQKFLARKEAEEKQKMEEARRRKEKLLELRSHDKKATRRVSVMLKRTKSANKAVIEDAKDADNTAVTLVGPSQPDEDDYGYVSKESEALYNKMMEKYNKMPEEDKFAMGKRKVSTNLSNTKEKVMAALERERLEASLPHRRKRKHQSSESLEPERSEVSPKYENEKKKEKTKFKAAPPVNFDDLLKLAAKKQHEPIIIEPKKVEEERLLTKKQKKEMEKEKEWRDRKESRGKPQPENRNTILKPPQAVNGAPTNDIKNIKKPEFKVPIAKPSLPSSNPPKIQSEKNPIAKDINKRVEKLPQKINDKERIEREKLLMKNPNLPSLNRNGEKKPIQSLTNGKRKELNSKDLQKRPLDVRPQKMQDIKPKEFPPKDLKPKQFHPSDLKPKQFPPPDVKKKQFPSKDVKRKPLVVNKGRILDDDDDYDSEMDDFIDDGPDEEQDYSSIIGQIFGYDKRRYKQYDDDDDTDNMESTFAQQMREECISTKIGIKEDLEDMQREEEEKKLKAQRMKKLRRV
ncbi:protein SPT2 homolog [Onthophagus taurus]|uniref:protein SPT2 homolog n=1 Tax=Onthophagus taurus TaxID=166361 RepID=UPI0039BE8E63